MINNDLGEKPAIVIMADSQNFDDDVLRKVMEELRKDFRVGGGSIHQYSQFPPPNVIIELSMLTIQTIALNLISSALYDVLVHRLFRPKHAMQSHFEFKLVNDTRYVSASITTDDKEIMREALDTIRELAKPENCNKGYRYNSQTHLWENYFDDKE